MTYLDSLASRSCLRTDTETDDRMCERSSRLGLSFSSSMARSVKILRRTDDSTLPVRFAKRFARRVSLTPLRAFNGQLEGKGLSIITHLAIEPRQRVSNGGYYGVIAETRRQVAAHRAHRFLCCIEQMFHQSATGRRRALGYEHVD